MTRRKFLNSKNNSKNTRTYDYKQEGVLFKKTVSPSLYGNVLIKTFLDHLSAIFTHMIDNVSNIRRQYMYSVDIDDSNIE